MMHFANCRVLQHFDNNAGEGKRISLVQFGGQVRREPNKNECVFFCYLIEMVPLTLPDDHTVTNSNYPTVHPPSLTIKRIFSLDTAKTSIQESIFWLIN